MIRCLVTRVVWISNSVEKLGEEHAGNTITSDSKTMKSRTAGWWRGVYSQPAKIRHPVEWVPRRQCLGRGRSTVQCAPGPGTAAKRACDRSLCVDVLSARFASSRCMSTPRYNLSVEATKRRSAQSYNPPPLRNARADGTAQMNSAFLHATPWLLESTGLQSDET